MTKDKVIVFLLISFAALAGNRPEVAQMEWSVHPAKSEFQRSEPIVLAYEFINSSKSEVWVPKSINPFASVSFRLYQPDGHPMSWIGAQFTFKYSQSDFEKLRPGQRKSGTFIVPRACPGERAIEKGGFCFQKDGIYKGTAKLREGAPFNRVLCD